MADSNAAVAHAKCEAMKDKAVNHCPRVMFMLDAIRSLGCKVGDEPEKSFISCAKLDGTKAGGFQTQGGTDPHIFLAEDVGYAQRQVCLSPYGQFFLTDYGLTLASFYNNWMQVEQTLTHELVHAYDQCRAKVRWDNLLHHACTEIRASALSGECDYTEEVNRGNILKVPGQGEACVRRRAELSVAMNPACAGDKAKAAAAVASAFERCYFDTSPFRRMP